MRAVKYRVWDKEDKKYLLPENQGFVILPTMPSFGVTIPYENHSNPDNIDEDCIDWADADLLMGRYELEQYTGLNDKNGKEICENDIVKVDDSNILQYHNKFFGDNALVKCSLSRGGAFIIRNWYGERILDWDISLRFVEVVGTIHENPELLKGNKE